jgi:subtilisin family serine protease
MLSGGTRWLRRSWTLLCLLLALLAPGLGTTAQQPLALVNDPDFGKQWNLHDDDALNGTITPDIQAPAAWDITTGSSDTIIAVLDSGVDLDHPDLASKLWTNPGEIPDNGRDDDGNGKVDDVNGWDFVDDDNRPDDRSGWGTFMAGIAAAASNNEIGIASAHHAGQGPHAG